MHHVASSDVFGGGGGSSNGDRVEREIWCCLLDSGYLFCFPRNFWL